MKSLRDYLEESKHAADNPLVGDTFAINIREECLIESVVLENRNDGVVIAADDRMIELLESYGYTFEQTCMECGSSGCGCGSSEQYSDTADQDPGEYDQEGSMAKDELLTMMRSARKLIGMLDNNDNMPEWTQKKITKATDYADTAADYISSQKERGVMEGDRESNPVARAILHRIMMQHTGMLAQHGPERVMAAVDELADRVNIGPDDEIGTSDVSGYVRQVQQMLDSPREQGMAEGQGATTYTVAYKDPKKPGKSYSTQVKATSAAEAKAAFQEWDTTNRFTYLGSRPDVDTVYEEQGVAEDQLDEIGNTPAGKAALRAVQTRATDTMDTWSKNSASGYSGTPKQVNKATGAAVSAGNRLHGFGPDRMQQNTVMARDALRKGMAEGADDKFSAADKVEELVRNYKLFDERGWTDLFSKLAGKKLYGPEYKAEIYRAMEYASKFLQLLDSIRMRSDYRGQQDPKKDQELIDLSNQWLDLFNKATSEYKAMSGQGVAEAEYQGRKVPLGKPMQGDVKKSKVYVKNPQGNVVKVNFGDPNMTIKKSNPARRKSFRARHNCDNPGPRTKARYWSCRAW